MTKEQQKDKIIEIVKNAINDNSVTLYGADDMVSIDGDDVDHIAEEVAEEVYDLRISVFGNEIKSLKRGIKELQDKNAELKRECNEYYAQADRLQAKLAQVLMRVDKTKEWTLDRAKIEGAKEFAEKLKEKFDGYDATSYNGYEEGFHDLQEEIDEVLKEYTE